MFIPASEHASVHKTCARSPTPFIFFVAEGRVSLGTWEGVSTSPCDIPSVRYFSAPRQTGKETAIVAFQRAAPANLIIRKSSPPLREREKEKGRAWAFSQSEMPPIFCLRAYYYHRFMVYSEASETLRYTFSLKGFLTPRMTLVRGEKCLIYLYQERRVSSR